MSEKQAATISDESVRQQLGKLLSSAVFANADQSRALLKFVVEQTVGQRTDRLKEYTVGAEALGRGESFDPRTDTVVRAEASRLRTRLERYYAGEGETDPVRISLPRGSYIPLFAQRDFTEATSKPPTSTTPEEPARKSRRIWLAAASLAVAPAAGVWALMSYQSRRAGKATPGVVQFNISLPPGSIFEAPIGRQSMAISPDGTRLAFVVTDSGGARLWIRELASLDLKPVPGTEGARTVFWAPDSRSLCFSVKRQFKQADLASGSTQSLGRLPFSAMYGSWHSKNELILYLGPRTFYELQIKSGSLRALPGASMRWAEFLPGNEHFVHVVFDPGLGRYRALVTHYATGKSISLMETDSRVQFAPPSKPGDPSHLLFIRGSSLLAQTFDADGLRLIGEPFSLVQNITFFGPSASGNFSVSRNGVLAYQSGFPSAELRWYDRSGNIVGTVGRPMPFNGTVRIAPDGRHLVAGVWSAESGGIDVWEFSADGSDTQRRTFPPAVHPRSVWSPDGLRLALASTQTGAPHLATLELTEQAKETPVMNAQTANEFAAYQIQLPTDWSRDGRLIAYDISLGEEEREVWLADVNSGLVQPLLKNQSSQWGASFSPDGRQMAFVSDESGRPEVYVQAFQADSAPHLVGQRHQVSKEGAWVVRWRPDGRELIFLGIDNWLRASAFPEQALDGQSNPLFRIPGTSQYGTMSDFQFDVSRDGQRLIMSTTGSVQPPPFTVIGNWKDKFRSP